MKSKPQKSDEQKQSTQYIDNDLKNPQTPNQNKQKKRTKTNRKSEITNKCVNFIV